MTRMTDSGARISDAQELLPRAFRRPALEQLKLYGGWAAFLGLVAYTLALFDFSPMRLAGGLGKLADVLGFMLPPHVWGSWEEFLEPVAAIGETLAMAFLGTLFAAVVAAPLGFLGARNVLRLPVLRFGVRRGFDALRALEQIILALIFIRAFGLGPLAGIFAIAVSDVGSLSKLFAEAIENVDRRPVEGVTAAGASRLQALRLAVTPQVLPVLTSHVLYYFESNTRSASTLGVVGAGGIGYMLADRIGANNWPQVMSILILLLITVGAIDAFSARLRRRVIAGAPLPAAKGDSP